MEVTRETFARDVIARSHELPVVVDFWAAWCGPCRMLGPALDAEAGKRAGRLELVKLDVDAAARRSPRATGSRASRPSVFRDGELMTGFIGAQPASALGRFFDRHVLTPA